VPGCQCPKQERECCWELTLFSARTRNIKVAAGSKGDDSASVAAPHKTPAEKLAQLALALSASAGETPRIRSKSSPNLSALDAGAAKPLQSVREGFQTVPSPPHSISRCHRTLLTFAKGLVGVEFNRRNGDTFGLPVCIYIASSLPMPDSTVFCSRAKAHRAKADPDLA
jgi:hypothetical protein